MIDSPSDCGAISHLQIMMTPRIDRVNRPAAAGHKPTGCARQRTRIGFSDAFYTVFDIAPCDRYRNVQRWEWMS